MVGVLGTKTGEMVVWWVRERKRGGRRRVTKARNRC
jgi:hypothetical protein